MDFSNRGERPVQTQQQPARAFENSMPQQAAKPEKSKKMGGMSFSKIGSIFLLLGTGVILLAVIFALTFGGNSGKKEADLVAADKYQAVFLNSQDGQVYFGKLGVYNKDLYVLTDIYYVRVETPIQPEGTNQAASQQKISLAKLGNELHGPEDIMYVSRDKVLYWENLKDDGQVVKAITEYKKNGSTTTTPTTGSSTPASTTTDTTTDTTTNP